MAYPRGFQPPGLNAETTNLPQVSESHVGFAKPDFLSPVMIHFDIDASNGRFGACYGLAGSSNIVPVLVGDFDEDEHNLVPLIKVSAAPTNRQKIGSSMLKL